MKKGSFVIDSWWMVIDKKRCTNDSAVTHVITVTLDQNKSLRKSERTEANERKKKRFETIVFLMLVRCLQPVQFNIILIEFAWFYTIEWIIFDAIVAAIVSFIWAGHWRCWWRDNCPSSTLEIDWRPIVNVGADGSSRCDRSGAVRWTWRHDWSIRPLKYGTDI